MGDFKCVCSFQQYSTKESNVSARNKSARSIFIVNNCSSGTKEHFYGCFKASREVVEEDGGKLCLACVGLLDECGEDLTICPEHRNEFSLEWRPSKVCKYPEHQSKQKPYRGISREMSRKISLHFGVLCETGQVNKGKFHLSSLSVRCLRRSISCCKDR